MRFFLILLLTFSLQSAIKADNIENLVIEGMSIGDSATKFFQKNEINKHFYPKSKKFYYSVHFIDNSENYDEIQIHLKDNDDNFIIQGLRAGKLYGNNISKCLLDKKKLVEEVRKIIGSNIQPKSYPKYKHSDMYPNSFVHTTHFEFKNGNLVRVYCMDFTKKLKEEKGWEDSLSIEIYNNDYRTFINEKAYK